MAGSIFVQYLALELFNLQSNFKIQEEKEEIEKELADVRFEELQNARSNGEHVFFNKCRQNDKLKRANKYRELRNNNISGSIPSSIGEFQQLILLDLSFNRISGKIHGSIFNLNSLSYL
ncbi:hypothetical protein P8452_56764 [Trifolium repens]|nr:hypothetical protein P8452_56764 [Trifolium repens]